MSSLQTIVNIGNLNTDEVTSMRSMFRGCSIKELNLSYFNTDNVKDMSYMFYGSSLTSLDVTNFNTESVIYMGSMFSCSSLKSLNLSNFDTKNVKDMSDLFNGCRNLTTIYVGTDWNTENVTSSTYMFYNCTNLMGYQGTTYDANHIDKKYARIDGGVENPGYFTNPNALQAYSVYDADNTTLTFYYDTQRCSRMGTTFSISSISGWVDYSINQPKITVTKVIFAPSFIDVRINRTAFWFVNMTQLTSIVGVEYLNTSEVTSMQSMFFGCNSLTSLDVSNFNTQNVTNMSYMFSGCSGLTSLNLGSFNTANVIRMDYMFSGCTSLTSLDVSSFNTANVTRMDYMFRGCNGLTSIDLIHFNTANVIRMDYMFSGCTNLTSLNLSSFNTQNVTNMTRMFNGCGGLKTIFVGDGWSTEKVVISEFYEDMFTGSTNLMGGMGTPYDANHVNKAYARIDGGEASPGYFTDPDANQAYTVYDADNTTLTFYYDKQRVSRGGDILRYGNRYPAWYDYRASVTAVVFDASFADARPTTTYSWFKMENLTSITGIEYLNTSEVTNMRAMFMGCSELTSLDVSGFVTDKVTDMYGMFTGCFKVNSLNLSNFNTSEVTNMYGMFTSCMAIANLDLSSFNTSKVIDMDNMFESCSSLTSLDLSSFNTSNVTNMSGMFNDCTNLTTIFVDDSWSTASVTSSENMFAGCTNLVGGMGTTYDTNHVDKEYARVDNAPESPGYFTDPNNIIDPNAPYAVLVEDGTNLQFRNDGRRLSMSNLKTYSLNTGGNRPGWVVDGSNAAITSVTFLDSFASARPTSMHSWLEGMTNLTRVWNPEYLNTSEVTDMANLFKDCSKLTSDKFDISGFTTTQVRDMSSMFEGCVMATAIDVSHFDTQNVTDMGSMFSGCIRLTTLNVSGLNTAKVTDMGKMFYDCGGYAGTLGTLDVTSFDTRLVTDMNGMFYHVTARVDVTGFDTQNVTDMHEMFKNVSAETLDLRSFNTSKVTDMSGMFEKCLNLTTITAGSGWTVANVTSSENMFDLCGRLCGDKGTSYKDANPKDKTYAHLDGGTADPGYLTDVNGPYAALSQDGKTLTFYKDGQRLTRTEKTYSLNAGIFANPGWTTDGSNATIESVVFDESFADARPASTMGWFSGMTSLTSLTGMENLNTSEVTLMSSMFYHCTGLTSIDLSHLNTAKVTAMTSMFNGCTGLTTLDLMTFDTGNVTSMSYMFYGCSNLTTIYAGGGWSTAKVDEESSGHMFDGCTSLVGGMGTTYDESCVDKAYARLDGGADSPGYFSSTPAYAALSEDGKTLTFYCDMLRSTRGKTYDLNEPGDVDDTEWYNDGSYSDITTVVFDASFASARPLGTTSWFQELENLTSIIGMEYLNTSEVTDMSFMFQNCLSLTSLDLSHFDTGKVTNMRSMFNCCSVLTSLDLSSFNTENVTDMGYMFAQCYSLTSIAVGHLNTTKVKYMDKMFFGCSGLTSIDFTGFGFQTGSVTDMCNMFDGCSKLTYLNTSKAFKYGTQNVTDMSYMFRGCSSLTSLNLQPLNTPMVTNMSYMFQGCSSLTELTLNSYYFMTKSVTTMAHMFDGCSVLTSLDVSGFNTSKVTDMSFMFNGCQALKSLDFSNFNTANLTTMNRMFMNCRSLKTLDLSSFNTDNVKNRDMDWLFGMCSSLERVDVSNFNTSGLTGLWSMFIGCSSLKSLDLTSFNTAKVTLTTTMFQDCSNLKTVYVGDGWDMSKVTTSPGMFSGCTSIVGGMGTTFDENHVDKAYAHIDGGTSNPGYFTEMPDLLPGDVNGDGKVDVADITALTNYLLGTGGSFYKQAADVNLSGSVTIADTKIIVEYLLGKIDMEIFMMEIEKLHAQMEADEDYYEMAKAELESKDSGHAQDALWQMASEIEALITALQEQLESVSSVYDVEVCQAKENELQQKIAELNAAIFELFGQ